jgi:hypothetical protein
MIKRQASIRVVNDIIQALRAIDNYREAVETPRDEIALVPRSFELEAATRLALARNIRIFNTYEADLRRRHDDLVVSMDPVELDGRLQVPEDRMPEFTAAWGRILDEVREIGFHEIDVNGLRGGVNAMPLALLGYLYHLADPESLRAKFGGLSSQVELQRSEALMLLLTGLSGLDGRPATLTDQGNQVTVSILWNYPPQVREILAYNLFILHQSVADLNSRRTELLAKAGTGRPDEVVAAEQTALLEEMVDLPLVKIKPEDLNLSSNAIPLAVIDQIQVLMIE